MSGHQPSIYTIHESQVNGQRQSQSDLLIDTSGIPLQHQPMPPLQHQHLQPTQAAGGLELAVTSQPGGQSARVAPEDPSVVLSVHPAFGLLEQRDALLVRQRADPEATCCGFESSNAYAVRAKDGALVLRAVESSNCCERCCFESSREFSLALFAGEEAVARIRKAHRVSRLCCYSNAVRVESPPDNPVGYIRQQFALLGHPKFAVYDCQAAPRTPTFLLESSSCRFCCAPLLCTCACPSREFRVLAAETREQVASIARACPPPSEAEPFGGDGRLFGVEFAVELEPRHKLLLLAACFTMDFFYFESDRRRRKLASC